MSTPKKSSSGTLADAIELLKADHAEVRKLFKQYDKLAESEGSDAERQTLAEQLCTKLTVHTQLEEELLYPAARGVLEDDADLVDEATVEHASAKDLIAQIRAMQPGDDLYDAKVKVLGEYVDHHVKEEEGEMFPKLKKAGLDVVQLGEEIAVRKTELTAKTTTA
jgi:hemerythrin superfamily protein